MSLSLSSLGITNIPVLISGFVGSLVSVLTGQKVSIRRGAFMIFTGCSTAVYLHPLVEHYLGTSPTIAPGIGFILALSSMNIVKKIISYIKEINLEDLTKGKLTKEK